MTIEEAKQHLDIICQETNVKKLVFKILRDENGNWFEVVYENKDLVILFKGEPVLNPGLKFLLLELVNKILCTTKSET